MGRKRRGISAVLARPARTGIGRHSSPVCERVSDDLRLGTGDFLDQRRHIAALAWGAAAAYGVVGLYQFGLVRRVPEPSLPGLDADRVDAGGEAYDYLHTPDAALGLTSIGATLVLAGMGDRRRHHEHPWVPMAAAVKAVADAGMAMLLFTEQVTKHRRVCSWCTLAAALNLAAVPPSLAEGRAALSTLRRRGAPPAER